MSLSFNDIDKTLTKLNEAQLKKIRKIYYNAYKSIEQEIQKLNTSTFSGKLQEEQFKKLKGKLHKAYLNTGKQIKSLVETGMYKSSEIAINNNNDWLKKHKLNIEGAYNYVPDDVVRLISSGQIYKGNWTPSKSIWADIDKKQKDIEQIIAIGIAQNKTSFDIAKDLEKYVDPTAKKDYDWSKTYPGVNKTIDYNAIRLSKTLISHAYQQSYKKTVIDNPFITGTKWNIANNHRVCDLCKERARQDKYGLGAGIFPKDKIPMDHPNGQCVLTSITLSSSDIADRLSDWALGKDDKNIDKWAKELLGDQSEVKKQYPKNFVEKDFEKNKFELNKYEIQSLLDKAKMYGKDLENMSEAQIQEQIYFCLDWYKQDGTCVKELYYWSKIKGVKFDDDGKVLDFGNTNINKVKQVVQKSIKENTDVNKAKVVEDLRKQYKNALNKNGDKIIEKLEKELQNLQENLTEKQERALRTYTGSLYDEMNKHLRGIRDYSEDKDVTEAIKYCKSALKISKTKEDLYVRRGSDVISLAGLLPGVNKDNIYDFSYKIKEDYKSIIGKMVQDKGFMSTTPISTAGFSSSGVEYIIKLPKGTNGTYVAPISYYKSEKEFLIQAGTRFKVEDIEQLENNSFVVYMTAIVK